ncbi:hypothetical protein DY000_02015281 [Brassica cretica]|uniref:Uncharacterized protein n=1 Tax=Brassica cretica TaxID=69181 RepID=A0ABQ7CXM8_BRACR|nr:hypothetical protein DY000_02015281 [Brassica cretica]
MSPFSLLEGSHRKTVHRFPSSPRATKRGLAESHRKRPRREPPKEASPFRQGVVEVSRIRSFATERRETKNGKRERKKK